MKALRFLAPLLCIACGASASAPAFGPLEDRRPTAPRQAVATTSPASSDSPTRPRLLERRRLRLVPPTESRLSNGIRVLLLERHDFPALTASFVLDRGAAAAGPGVAALYAEALEGDSADFSSKDAFEYFHYVGAQTSTWATRDGVALRLKVLSPLFEGALVRAGSMFASPMFASDDLARARRDASATAARQRQSPSATAQRTVRGMVLGKDHPYAAPVYAGADARYEKMSKSELESFRSMFAVPERMTVVIAGDFQEEAILARLERRLGKIPAKKSGSARDASPRAPEARPRIIVVPRKGASQSNIAIGFAGVASTSEDRAALSVLETMLGRAFSGRLEMKTRGEHGYTYGVTMNAASYRTAGTIEITTAVDAAHTADAVKGLLGELARVGSTPIDESELGRAKAYAIASLGEGESSGDMNLVMLETIAIENLPLDWYEKVAARIEALDEAAIRATATRLLATDRAQIAVVGDPDVIVGPLRALGLATVETDPGSP